MLLCDPFPISPKNTHYAVGYYFRFANYESCLSAEGAFFLSACRANVKSSKHFVCVIWVNSCMETKCYFALWPMPLSSQPTSLDLKRKKGTGQKKRHGRLSSPWYPLKAREGKQQ